MDKVCYPNTRAHIVEEIISWVAKPVGTGAQIFWLHGVAGSGKSAIAHTVANCLSRQGWLGSAFMFDRTHIEERDPAHLFATVTRDLANKDPCWKSSLADAITKNKDISTTPSVTGHFQKFFRNIAHDSCMSFMGPIAIVIDGLDESKAGDSRKLLLKILQHEVS